MKKTKKRDYFVSCIIAAGGKSRRMGEGVNKLFLDLGGIPVLARTLLAFEKSDIIDEIIVSCGESDILKVREMAEYYGINKLKSIVKGGEERAESIKNAILEISENCDIVAVHDGARPLVDEEIILKAVLSCREYGAAASGVRPKSTLKREDENGFIEETIDRSKTIEIQTPQVFSKELFVKAYDADDTILKNVTDDCALVERLGVKIKITEGSYKNIKITTKEDILVAECLLNEKF